MKHSFVLTLILLVMLVLITSCPMPLEEDNIRPYISMHTFSNSSTDISINTSIIEISFSEPMESSYEINHNLGNISVIWATSDTLQIDIKSELQYDHDYFLVLNPSSSEQAFKDLNSNYLPADSTICFSTESYSPPEYDQEAPYLSSHSLTNNDTNVSIQTTQIDIIFSEPMSHSVSINFNMEDWTITWISSNTLRFQLGAELEYNHEYIIVLNPSLVSPSFKDLSGNYLPPDTEIRFTTEPDPSDKTLPVITIVGDENITIFEGEAYTDPGAYALDDVDGDLTDKIIISNRVNTYVPGTYSVIYQVSDLSGNAALEVSRTVQVITDESKIVEKRGELSVYNTFNNLYFDRKILIEDRNTSKFNFYYYIPEEALKRENIRTLLFFHSSTPDMTDYAVLQEHLEETWIPAISSWAESRDYTVIVVIVPRESQKMNRNVIIPAEIADPFSARPDLEVYGVLKSFFESAQTTTYNFHGKVFVHGASDGGIQTNIFSILHPDIVEAAFISNAGSYCYPLTNFNGNELFHPAGISEIDLITGNHYSLELYTQIEHRTTVGENDLYNDPVGPGGMQSDWVDMYTENFGETCVDRVPIFAEQLRLLGMDSESIIYPGIGHEYPANGLTDIFDFFDSIETP